jgi:hypothetical protein
MSSPRAKIGGKKTVSPSKAGASSVAKPLLTPCPSHLQKVPNGQKVSPLAEGMCPFGQSFSLSSTAALKPQTRSPLRTSTTTSLVSATKLRRESKTPPLAQSVPLYRQKIRKTLSDSQYGSLTVVIDISHCGSILKDLLMRLLIPRRNRSRQSNNLPLLLLIDHNERKKTRVVSRERETSSSAHLKRILYLNAFHIDQLLRLLFLSDHTNTRSYRPRPWQP